MSKRILTVFAVIMLALLLLTGICAISAHYSAHTLIVSRYEIAASVQTPLRIVQLSDLHGREFGESNQELIERVNDLRPNMIVLTGDMLSDNEDAPGLIADLLASLSSIAPTYYGYGNQEISWESRYDTDLRPTLQKAGATVLEREYIDLEWGGGSIRIGGYAGYYRAPRMMTEDREQQAEEIRFADEFEDTAAYKILLNHIPTVWLDGDHLGQYKVDLVLCGHYHGGQIRLPFGGGLYAPYVGWFPPYTMGLFQKDDSSLVLSAGLGSQKRIPRINNPGEIVCVDLLPEK